MNKQQYLKEIETIVKSLDLSSYDLDVEIDKVVLNHPLVTTQAGMNTVFNHSEYAIDVFKTFKNSKWLEKAHGSNPKFLAFHSVDEDVRKLLKPLTGE